MSRRRALHAYWMAMPLVICAACGREEPAAVVVDAPAAVAHGDHSPHHGGVVMMNGDLHYEVVLDPAGRHRLYFTDAARVDLPAATASAVSIRVNRPAQPAEEISMRIDDTGESWIGEGRPVTDAAASTVRVSYTIRGREPYWIDLPFKADPVDPAAPDPHKRIP
jgi:hypothetical protein